MTAVISTKQKFLGEQKTFSKVGNVFAFHVSPRLFSAVPLSHNKHVRLFEAEARDDPGQPSTIPRYSTKYVEEIRGQPRSRPCHSNARENRTLSEGSYLLQV